MISSGQVSAERSEAVRLLKELGALFRRHGVEYVFVIDAVLKRLTVETRDDLSPTSRTELRTLFGGMGSLTDVVIDRRNGHHVEDEGEANRGLDRLTNDLWRLVTAKEK